jgi:hypothetical protein
VAQPPQNRAVTEFTKPHFGQTNVTGSPRQERSPLEISHPRNLHYTACIATGMEIAAFRFVILATRTGSCHHRLANHPWYAR